MRKIESLQNSLIKDILKLQEKSRERKKRKLFIIEGKREISLALQGNYQIDTVLITENIFEDENLLNNIPKDTNQVLITKEVYQKLAYRDSTEGILAVVKTKDFSLESIKFKNKTPLVLVMESIEKPGNIGAMLRTADAANIDAVFIADAKSEIFNPNIIRSSVGCVFTNQIAVASSEEIINYLKQNHINIYAATLQNSNVYATENFTEASALVVGTEATGLTEIWRENATQNINIPMQGVIDSMNVSVAGAILLYEAKRQRGFNL